MEGPDAKRWSCPIVARSPCLPCCAVRFGIKGGDVLILEDRDDEIVLKPGVVLEAQYSTVNKLPSGTLRTGCRTGSEHAYPSSVERIKVVPRRDVTFPATHRSARQGALVLEFSQAGTLGELLRVYAVASIRAENWRESFRKLNRMNA